MTITSPQSGSRCAIARLRALLLLLCVLLPIAPGCATTIVPPPKPADPVAVYLLDHGRTPSLVLPTPEGQLVRYAYGDWTYYALNRKGPLVALPALLLPTRGALGRGTLDGPPSVWTVYDQVYVGFVELYAIGVEREAAYRLHRRLDALFQVGREDAVPNVAAGLTFVPHPQAYSLLYNSNRAVADWFEVMDCEVRGPALTSNWRIEGAAEWLHGHGPRPEGAAEAFFGPAGDGAAW